MDLKINESKTKYIKTIADTINGQLGDTLSIGDQYFEIVDDFIYLMSWYNLTTTQHREKIDVLWQQADIFMDWSFISAQNYYRKNRNVVYTDSYSTGAYLWVRDLDDETMNNCS